jgi:hypothetical protein
VPVPLEWFLGLLAVSAFASGWSLLTYFGKRKQFQVQQEVQILHRFLPRFSTLNQFLRHALIEDPDKFSS